MNKSEIVDKSETQTEVCKAASHEKLSVKEKLKAEGGSRKESEDLEILIKTEVDEEEVDDLEMDRVVEDRPKVKVGRKRKKEARKTKKMKKREMPEMKDLMVGRRMASLNASAMMQVVILFPYILTDKPFLPTGCSCQEQCYDRPEMCLELPTFSYFH